MHTILCIFIGPLVNSVNTCTVFSLQLLKIVFIGLQKRFSCLIWGEKKNKGEENYHNMEPWWECRISSSVSQFWEYYTDWGLEIPSFLRGLKLLKATWVIYWMKEKAIPYCAHGWHKSHKSLKHIYTSLGVSCTSVWMCAGLQRLDPQQQKVSLCQTSSAAHILAPFPGNLLQLGAAQICTICQMMQIQVGPLGLQCHSLR